MFPSLIGCELGRAAEALGLCAESSGRSLFDESSAMIADSRLDFVIVKVQEMRMLEEKN